MTKCLLALSLLGLTGCAVGKAKWTGLVPGKDFELINGEITLTTPWGTESVKAGVIRSWVNPKGVRTNWLAEPLRPQAQPAADGANSVLITPSLMVKPQ